MCVQEKMTTTISCLLKFYEYMCICMCTHVKIIYFFPSGSIYELRHPSSAVSKLCVLTLSLSIVTSIHLYFLNMEAHILHFWDTFFYYFFTFSLFPFVLTFNYWTSRSDHLSFLTCSISVFHYLIFFQSVVISKKNFWNIFLKYFTVASYSYTVSYIVFFSPVLLRGY